MTNKLGYVRDFGCYGKKAIDIFHPPNSGDVTIELPECFNNIPNGLLAYLDSEGKIRFMEEDPHDYR